MERIYKTFYPSIILMMPRMFYRGVILYFCWLWFIVPFGLPIIPIWYAIPISGLISILTFEQIGRMHDPVEAWKRVGEWSVGATVFFASAFMFHILRG